MSTNKTQAWLAFCAVLLLLLCASVWLKDGSVQGQSNTTHGVGTGSPEGKVPGGPGSTYARTDGDASTCFYVKTGGGETTTGWTAISASGGTGVPSGSILMVNTGACPAGYTEVAAMAGKLPRGTLLANADVGGTGGSSTITPSGTVSAPAFTGNAASLTHSGAAVGNHTLTTAATGSSGAARVSGPTSLTHTVTQPNAHSYTPAGTNSAPAFTGSAVDPSPPYVKVIFCKKD